MPVYYNTEVKVLVAQNVVSSAILLSTDLLSV